MRRSLNAPSPIGAAEPILEEYEELRFKWRGASEPQSNGKGVTDGDKAARVLC